jgi:hypothetical protein
MTCAILEDGGECPLLDGAASREINEGLNNTEIWNGTTDRAKHGVVMAQNEDRMRGIISLPIALAAAICLQPADSVMTVYSFASSGEAQQKQAALFSVDAGPRQEKADVPTQLYQDLKYGVSFQYPSIWTRISKDDQGYFGTKILGSSPGSDIKFRAAVKFSPSGNYYEKTDLEDLSFTYAVANAASQKACDKIAASNVDPGDHPRTMDLAGVKFTQIEGGDAGMMQGVSLIVASTYRQGTCFLFEQDEGEIAAKTKPGSRPLTVQEERNLKRHLNAVLASVRFTRPISR